jgi:4a-hydroxytetrahydrobiopterin dehydratase
MARDAKIEGAALDAAVAGLDEWTLVDGELVREAKFADFVAAMEFVNRVASMAESEAHHPDIDIRYNQVRLALVTHDAGGITARDVAMAKKLNQEISD